MSTIIADVAMTAEDFDELLHKLDQRIDEPIEINAIGGYALLHHGIRETGVTADIDTVTPAYSPAVQQAIYDIAEENNLPPDWLNNDCVYAANEDGLASQADCDAYNMLTDAFYDPIETDFEHITMRVADLPTIAHGKAFAVNDIGRGRTEKDRQDLIALFEKMGCHSIKDATKQCEWLNDQDFIAAKAALLEHYDPSAKISPDEFYVPVDDFDAYSLDPTTWDKFSEDVFNDQYNDW